MFFALLQTLFFKGRSPDDPACTVEGVVFGMRQNGFIVYVPCYALKGPVHLTEADTNQVVYLHRRHGPTLLPGKVIPGDNQISVQPDDDKR